MPAPFGATLDGVKAYLPHLDLDAGDRVGPEDVARFLDTIGGTVAGRLTWPLARLQELQDLGTAPAGTVEAYTLSAAGVVEMGAAAMAQDASFPELSAARETDTSYGAALWARHRQALDDLLAEVTAELARYDVATVDASAEASAAGAFPEPMFTRDRPW